MDYKNAYFKLFNAMTDIREHIIKAVDIVEKSQQQTEEFYIDDESKINIISIDTEDNH